jgi:hypothetical protein
MVRLVSRETGRHCERSEAINSLAHLNWIASSLGLLAMPREYVSRETTLVVASAKFWLAPLQKLLAMTGISR